MRRLLAISFAAVAALVLFGLFGGSASAAVPRCNEPTALCAEPVNSIGYGGEYTGHDEPSLLFYSNTAGSGNSNLYNLTLPSDPKVLPNQAGTAGTWNFQLHPAFWLGMALCDNQSAPEFTHDPCTPDSDTNIFDGTNPAGPDYIGKHPGTAFLEVQFYPPGWAPWPPGVSCDPTQWCSAMAIFSLLQDQNTGVVNNANCRARAGDEPANFAFITTSGVPHAPPAPLTQTAGTFTPSAATDLFMGSGDQLTVDIHDGAAGLVVTIHDLTTGGTGSMTASAANGFAQVNFSRPRATCSQSPYTFRPMYATSSEHTRVPVGGAQLQRRLLRRDRPLRVLLGRHRRGRRLPQPTTRVSWTTTTRAASARRSRCSSRSEAASPRTTTSMGPRTSRCGREPIRTAGRTRSTTRARSRSRARSSTALRTTVASPSRPTCRGSRRRTPAASATGSRVRTA